MNKHEHRKPPRHLDPHPSEPIPLPVRRPSYLQRLIA